MIRSLQHRALIAFTAVAMAAVLAMPGAAQAGDIDSAHASVAFRITHGGGLSYTYGLFKQIKGSVAWNAADPSKSKFDVTIAVKSIDTANEKRDAHLLSDDFFNAAEFPVIAFKSTKVEKKGDAYHVTGDLMLHGVKKSITIPVKMMGENDKAMGFASEFTIKRSEYGMTSYVGPIGDDVDLMVSFEAAK